jgi:hypothetical protein
MPPAPVPAPKPPPAPAPKPPPAPAPKPPPAPAPKPTPNKKSDVNTNMVCIPTNNDGSFKYKDKKYPNKPDPNYIYSNSNPPASGIFDQWTANYNQYLNSNYYWYGGSINKYSKYAPMANSQVPNGTDCSGVYSCSPNTTNTNCLPSPGPTPPSCPSNCKKVKDPLMANSTYGVCSFDKKSETYTCAPCPTYGSDGMDCNQFQECSGCPASMTVSGLTPIDPRRKRGKRRGGGQCGGINGICYKGDDGWSDGSDNDDGLSDGGGNGNGGWSGGGGNGGGGNGGGGNGGGGNGGGNGGGTWSSGGDKYRRRDRHHHHRDERERERHQGGASYRAYGNGRWGEEGGNQYISKQWRRDENYKYKNNAYKKFEHNESAGCSQGMEYLKKFFNKVENIYNDIKEPSPYMDIIHF